jgi:hypothetical protein
MSNGSDRCEIRSNHVGATLVNEAGAVIWNELITDKPDSALPFYETVVGLTHSTMALHPQWPPPTPHPSRPITPSNSRARPLGAAVEESVR